MAVNIPPPEPLKKKGNLAENWRTWRQNFAIYLIAAQTDLNDDTTTCALFLHTIGQHGRDIFNEIQLTRPLINPNLESYYDVFENYCNPKKNITFCRYDFFNTKQEPNQSFDSFYSTLKQKSNTCDFGELCSGLLMTQIISGITNIKLRERLLKVPDLDLPQIVEECREFAIPKEDKKQTNVSFQVDKKPYKKFNKPIEEEKVIKDQKKAIGQKNHKSEDGTWCMLSKASPKQITNCKFCGDSHVAGNCPAFGSTCKKCKKSNHYAKVCKN